MRPTIVLMLGESGTGKTTLGIELSRVLSLPFLARDEVRRGLWFTNGAWGDQPGPPPTPDHAVDVFLHLLETHAAAGVSCVAEYVFRADRPDDLERIRRVATCIGVRTSCADAAARRLRRDERDALFRRPAVLDAFGFESPEARAAAANERMARVAAGMRTTFDFPVIDVDTTDGCDPSLDEIVAFVTR